jgi:hypothetical protein
MVLGVYQRDVAARERLLPLAFTSRPNGNNTLVRQGKLKMRRLSADMREAMPSIAPPAFDRRPNTFTMIT